MKLPVFHTQRCGGAEIAEGNLFRRLSTLPFFAEGAECAEDKTYYGFQDMDLPYYLYYAPVYVGDTKIYTPTMVKGFLINYDYSKMDTEDDTEPFRFLTELLRYRLKENPLAPTLLAYLSV